MARLTKAQQIALKRLYDRDWSKPASYLAFRRTVRFDFIMDCIMVPWCGIQLGIELNGYTHS